MKSKFLVLFALSVLFAPIAYAEDVNDFSKVSFDGCKSEQKLSSLKQNEPIVFNCSFKNASESMVPVFIKKVQISGDKNISQGLELRKLSPKSATTTEVIFFANNGESKPTFLISVYGAIAGLKDSYREGSVIGKEYTYGGEIAGYTVKVKDIRIDKNQFISGGRGLATVSLFDTSASYKLSSPVILTINTKDSKGQECTSLLRSESFVEKMKNVDFYVYPRENCEEISAISLALLSETGSIVASRDFPIQFGEKKEKEVVGVFDGLVDTKSIIVIVIIMLAIFGYRYSVYKKSIEQPVNTI